MIKIIDLKVLEVLDSRGNPTVQVKFFSESHNVRAMVPSGASTGIHEALELRDENPKRYNGKGVLKALNNIIEVIKPEILNKDFHTQEEFDALLLKLDGTENKSNLGANAMLACSMAFARLKAKEASHKLYNSFSNQLSLPIPMVNVLNGGSHADNNLDIQEFMIVPNGIEDFAEKIRAVAEIFQSLKSILKANNLVTSVGDEGGFAPNLDSNHQALDLLKQAIEKAGYTLGGQINFALDVAASEFYKDGKYNYEGEDLSKDEFYNKMADLVSHYPIISIEDPFSEDDFESFTKLTQEFGSKVQIVGDDLLVTNIQRLQKAIDEKACNAILIKLNQIGTVTETLQAIELAKENRFGVIISHRSGETEDTFIADLSVGMNAGQIKTGSVSRSDRVAKYNRLLQIDQELES